MSLHPDVHITTYNDAKLAELYPEHLSLRLVQILFRHGERTPVRQRLPSAGLPLQYRMCFNAERFRAAVKMTNGWNELPYARRLEVPANTRSGSGLSTAAALPGTCLLGELTDRGRQSTFYLGERLKELYVDRLGFAKISHESELYLRASPIPRALESLQHVFSGMFPRSSLPKQFELIIHQRDWTQENLYPNEGACKRLQQLAKEYAKRAALTWNPILAGHASELLSEKYLDGKPLQVDGNPRVTGLADTINAAIGNGLDIPAEFRDKDMLKQVEAAAVEEWFGGYLADEAYRRLGAGRLLGDFRDRMVMCAGRESSLKVALYGAHDTTIGAVLASLGVFDRRWPPFSSHIAIELFEDARASSDSITGESHLVRLRYNDKVLHIPGCTEAVHGFCTLKEFNKVIDELVPEDWEAECRAKPDLSA
ncbi:histidine phosphatase superfamily [Protomyces lactucae-debilis]|uniref:Histidine phosphatase superfamily n=1 Tax=Protomyces lactucae-debilis TaxID=2754530 RepID=A0A1Y2F2Z1_PROLT|nr:histidine phosphatase superfamily [Protomyces lactucae-debilis]ORY78251.1 histidine phosphatase superfamily [Protomyces lactucae-debilis]